MQKDINIAIDEVCIRYGVLNKSCEGSLNTIQGALTDALKSCLSKEVNILVDKSLYEFPKSYNNSQIVAFQKGVDKMWSTFLKRLEEE